PKHIGPISRGGANGALPRIPAFSSDSSQFSNSVHPWSGVTSLRRRGQLLESSDLEDRMQLDAVLRTTALAVGEVEEADAPDAYRCPDEGRHRAAVQEDLEHRIGGAQGGEVRRDHRAGAERVRELADHCEAWRRRILQQIGRA